MTSKARRQKLSSILHDILGSDNVYFQPPESVKLKYPAIVYDMSSIDTIKADNRNYLANYRFDVTFIHKDVDNEIVEKFLEIPFCEHNRTFKSDDLYHDVFTIYV